MEKKGIICNIRIKERDNFNKIKSKVNFKSTIDSDNNIPFQQNLSYGINYRYSKTQTKSKSIKNLLNDLMGMITISKTSIISQMRCLMVYSQQHDSYLLPKKLIIQSKLRLYQFDSEKQQTFSQKQFIQLTQLIVNKHNDSKIVIQCYQKCLINQYPLSLKLLILYMGVFLYQINGLYILSQDLCQKIFNQIIRIKIDQYLIIYLLLLIKLKTNILQWNMAILILMKLLAFSWVYKLNDLQIWCYFQLSRSYFFQNKLIQSNFFKKKSQMCLLQPQNSIYREVISTQLIQQLKNIKYYNYNFKFYQNIIISRLNNYQQLQIKQNDNNIHRKQMKTSIKKLHQICKTKYIKNLLPRLTHNKNYSQNQQNQIKRYAGNPQFITHQSHIKNLNMYFRIKKNNVNLQDYSFYTIQNSGKNWLILREMIKIILQAMKAIKKCQ